MCIHTSQEKLQGHVSRVVDFSVPEVQVEAVEVEAPHIQEALLRSSKRKKT